MTFNAFNIKKEAHREGRNSGYNPFGHIAWDSESNKRSSTFPQQPDEEAGIGSATRAVDPSYRLDHVQTAPTGSANSRSPLTNNFANGPQGFAPPEGVVSEGVARSGGAIEPSAESPTATLAADNGLKNRSRGSGAESSEGRQEPDDAHKNEQEKLKKDRSWIKHVDHKVPFTLRNQLQRTFLNSYINILLFAAPAGIALHFTNVDPIVIFVINFIAIVPLAAMLSFATEEIALRTGETLGGLLNATFGNAVELIVAIMALVKGEVVIVQTSLIGSILSNLLLVMGMCFFFGGLRRQEQYFNTTVAQTSASLLSMAVAGVIVPTVFDAASITSTKDVAMLSRGTSIILLVVYGAYLLFQLKTHQAVFSEESQKVPAKPMNTKKYFRRHRNVEEEVLPVVETEEEDEGEEPQLHFFVAIGVLVGSTVVIAFCAEFLVDSIDYVTSKGNISKEFLGLILLPIVGNAAEHATAVTVAVKDKMDLAIGVAVGSSMQVSLFLIPLLVVIGWGMGNDDMSLSFDIFQVAVLFVSVLLVNYLIGDGKSHWLEGMLLMCLYCIIAVCSWWYPA